MCVLAPSVSMRAESAPGIEVGTGVEVGVGDGDGLGEGGVGVGVGDVVVGVGAILGIVIDVGVEGHGGTASGVNETPRFSAIVRACANSCSRE